MNAVTHSYTIMPIISMAGKLIGPVFICLQKPTGKLGARVKQSIYQASNIHITCNKYGKITKTHIQYWAENVLSPSVSKDCVLLLDSWSGQLIPVFMMIFSLKTLLVSKCKLHQKQPVIFNRWIVIFSTMEIF
jgi:hypothetical protein